MSQPVLIKVYGNIFPASQDLLEHVHKICSQAISNETGRNPAYLDKDMLLISFEGIYFPMDELYALLQTRLDAAMSGKVDYLDLENWEMTRYLFSDGNISRKCVPLNHVLDYSGF